MLVLTYIITMSIFTSNFIKNLYFYDAETGHQQTVKIKKNKNKWLSHPSIHTLSDISKLSFNRQATLERSPHPSFNLPASKKVNCYRWDDRDFKNPNWLTQGTSGSYLSNGNRHIMVFSWYHKKGKGSRVTFVDMKSLRYRHVLLVKGSSFKNGSFQPLNIHAGGISWVGHYLYVASGKNGIRVFDTRNIFKTTKNKKGKVGIHQNQAYAFGYDFALPQVARIKLHHHTPKVSYLSLETKTNGERILWTGEFTSNYAKRPKITGFKLGENDFIHSYYGTIYPKDKNGDYVYYIQGVYRRENVTWLTRTGSSKYHRSNSRLVAYQDGEEKAKRWRWPTDTEELYYDELTDRLWCNNERQGKRYFFSVKLSTYADKL